MKNLPRPMLLFGGVMLLLIGLVKIFRYTSNLTQNDEDISLVSTIFGSEGIWFLCVGAFMLAYAHAKKPIRNPFSSDKRQDDYLDFVAKRYKK